MLPDVQCSSAHPDYMKPETSRIGVVFFVRLRRTLCFWQNSRSYSFPQSGSGQYSRITPWRFSGTCLLPHPLRIGHLEGCSRKKKHINSPQLISGSYLRTVLCCLFDADNDGGRFANGQRLYAFSEARFLHGGAGDRGRNS